MSVVVCPALPCEESQRTRTSAALRRSWRTRSSTVFTPGGGGRRPPCAVHDARGARRSAASRRLQRTRTSASPRSQRTRSLAGNCSLLTRSLAKLLVCREQRGADTVLAAREQRRPTISSVTSKRLPTSSGLLVGARTLPESAPAGLDETSCKIEQCTHISFVKC